MNMNMIVCIDNDMDMAIDMVLDMDIDTNELGVIIFSGSLYQPADIYIF
jgi:hypothetical protein